MQVRARTASGRAARGAGRGAQRSRNENMRRSMAAAVHQLSRAYPIGSRLTDDGRLQIGGCDALDLAREFGTPALVVAEDDIRTRVRAFKDAFAARTDDFEVHFAAKAFACTPVLALMAAEGLACDVAGGGELHMALKAGFDPGRIHLHGNAKSRRELQEAHDAGVDRKSTRLNSSHPSTSYARFCLKKKN